MVFNESIRYWKAEKKYPKSEVRYTKAGFEPLTETIIRNDKNVEIIVFSSTFPDNKLSFFEKFNNTESSNIKIYGFNYNKEGQPVSREELNSIVRSVLSIAVAVP